MDPITKSDIDVVFGKILRCYRLKNDLTQEQLAEKLGITLKYISRIENGNNGVKTQTIINYFNILGLTPNILYESFITNDSIKDNITLSNKISSLPKEKRDFIESIVDLLDKSL